MSETKSKTPSRSKFNIYQIEADLDKNKSEKRTKKSISYERHVPFKMIVSATAYRVGCGSPLHEKNDFSCTYLRSEESNEFGKNDSNFPNHDSKNESYTNEELFSEFQNTFNHENTCHHEENLNDGNFDDVDMLSQEDGCNYGNTYNNEGIYSDQDAFSSGFGNYFHNVNDPHLDNVYNHEHKSDIGNDPGYINMLRQENGYRHGEHYNNENNPKYNNVPKNETYSNQEAFSGYDSSFNKINHFQEDNCNHGNDFGSTDIVMQEIDYNHGYSCNHENRYNNVSNGFFSNQDALPVYESNFNHGNNFNNENVLNYPNMLRQQNGYKRYSYNHEIPIPDIFSGRENIYNQINHSSSASIHNGAHISNNGNDFARYHHRNTYNHGIYSNQNRFSDYENVNYFNNEGDFSNRNGSSQIYENIYGKENSNSEHIHYNNKLYQNIHNGQINNVGRFNVCNNPSSSIVGQNCPSAFKAFYSKFENHTIKPRNSTNDSLLSNNPADISVHFSRYKYQKKPSIKSGNYKRMLDFDQSSNDNLINSLHHERNISQNSNSSTPSQNLVGQVEYKYTDTSQYMMKETNIQFTLFE